jgi:predicted amidohydrolase
VQGFEKARGIEELGRPVTKPQTVRVAAVQAASVMFDAAATVDVAIGWLEKAAADGVQIALFPETFLSGYPFDVMGVEAAQIGHYRARGRSHCRPAAG